jgi:hypothetical protein
VCRHTAPRSRCAYPHEFCQNFLPSNVKGAGNAGRLMRPQPRVQSRKHTSSHHGHTGITRHSPHNGFTAYFVLSPVTGLFCHRRLARLLARLDASVGASGPHDFAVRFSAVRQRRRRVHRIPPRVRDDRERPSVGRDGGNIQMILFRKNRNIFAKGTGHATIRRRVRDEVICPSGKISSQVFIIMRLSAAQSPRLRASSCCKKVFANSVRLRLVRYEHAPGARSGTVDGKARQRRSTSRHCRIAGRIVRLPQHRCLPRKASARRGL